MNTTKNTFIKKEPIKEKENGCLNTDKNIWRKIKDDYYSPSIHVTKEGNIGINVGGTVIVKPIEEWFLLGDKKEKKEGGK